LTVKALAARPELAIDSIAPVVPAANWIEREMHDLLGAQFRNHPDMRRLILDDSWPQGVHPLRKDFDQVLDRPPLPSAPTDGGGPKEAGP
jgi:Ni,Fe-hydrogenase III component G